MIIHFPEWSLVDYRVFVLNIFHLLTLLSFCLEIPLSFSFSKSLNFHHLDVGHSFLPCCLVVAFSIKKLHFFRHEKTVPHPEICSLPTGFLVGTLGNLGWLWPPTMVFPVDFPSLRSTIGVYFC